MEGRILGGLVIWSFLIAAVKLPIRERYTHILSKEGVATKLQWLNEITKIRSDCHSRSLGLRKNMMT